MNLDLATKALEWTHVISKDEKGRATRISTPAHKGKIAIVTIDRQESGWYCTCNHISSMESDPLPCESKNVCYHILAAILTAAKGKGDLYFAKDKKTCERYLKSNPKAVCFRVKYKKDIVYPVWFPIMKQSESK